ncbi:hypothetical protein J7J18_03630 [bacterium]|nr:hypothetical protein [bacterium]
MRWEPQSFAVQIVRKDGLVVASLSEVKPDKYGDLPWEIKRLAQIFADTFKEEVKVSVQAIGEFMVKPEEVEEKNE